MQVSVAYFVRRHKAGDNIDWCGFKSLAKLDGFLGESEVHNKLIALGLTNKINFINFKVPRVSSLNLNFICLGRVEESMIEHHQTCMGDDSTYYGIWVFLKKKRKWALHSSFAEELPK